MQPLYEIKAILPHMFVRTKILVDLPKILQSVSFYYPMGRGCDKPFKNKTSEEIRQ
jgi:hypothetical protein